MAYQLKLICCQY